jgi:anti-sigma B factor antagonist
MRTLSVEVNMDTLDLTLHGEIDFRNAPAVIHDVESAIATAQPAMVQLHLTDVPFVDSSGVRALILTLRAARGIGARFRADGASPAVYDVLNRTGLLELLGLATNAPEPPPLDTSSSRRDNRPPKK